MNNIHKRCRIMILMLDERPFHSVMANLLFTRIMADDSGLYRASIHRINPDRESIKQAVRSNLKENTTDIFITIGDDCSIATKEALDEIGGYPMIFVGVRNPIELGLITSFERPGACINGIVRVAPPTLTIAKKFAFLYPAVKSVLIPYAADDKSLFNQAVEIKRYLIDIGMQVIIIPIDEDEYKTKQLIYNHITQIQGIIFLEGCHSSTIQNAVAYLCWEKCVVLCGNGPYAIDAGAACGLGGEMNVLSIETFKIIERYWNNKIPLGTTPITIIPDNQEFFINIDMLRRINIPEEAINKFCSQPNVKVIRIWTIPYEE